MKPKESDLEYNKILPSPLWTGNTCQETGIFSSNSYVNARGYNPVVQPTPKKEDSLGTFIAGGLVGIAGLGLLSALANLQKPLPSTPALPPKASPPPKEDKQTQQAAIALAVTKRMQDGIRRVHRSKKSLKLTKDEALELDLSCSSLSVWMFKAMLLMSGLAPK